jgi:cleavage and polyadenylation specificity factor subunit 2
LFAVDLNEVPTKCVSFTGVITVEAQIQFIDFEGRLDGESIQKIITSMKPRRLILVRGSEENTRALCSHAQLYTDARVYTPRVGELIDVTMETHIYQVIFFLLSLHVLFHSQMLK